MFHSTAARLAILALLFLPAALRADPIEQKPFGTTTDGMPVDQITLTNKSGASVRLITFGAIVTNIFMPDRTGKLGDVVLGYDTVKDYEMSGPFMGCIAGRYANRIANGTFMLDGNQYALTVNQGLNTLHGGFKGLAKRLWNADTGMTPDGPTVRFTIVDPDGAEGFPGTVNVTVLYTLTQNNWLKIQYLATTDKPTPINLTHHSYFNLSGTGKGDVLNYIARVNAAHYLPVDDTLIPTGQIAPVAGTPFDFTKAKPIGRDIKSVPGSQTGYDHTMLLDNPDAKFIEAADVYDPDSGRLLQCWTTEPAVHFFTGGNLNSIAGKNGQVYMPYSAFCLETQHYPDSPNHPEFPSTILRPGHVYRQVTEFRFSIPEKPLEAEQ